MRKKTFTVTGEKDGRQRGFSLLEAVLALALLGLVIVPLLGFFGKTMGYLAQADIREKAVLLARDRLEAVKAVNFAELEEEVEVLTRINPEGYPEYERSVEVSAAGGLKEVVITVYWNSRQGKVELKTRMAER